MDKKLLECFIISSIGLCTLISNWYIHDYIAIWLFIIVIVIVLTLESTSTRNKNNNKYWNIMLHYRCDADEGFVYALLTVPTVLAVQKQFFNTQKLKSSLEIDYSAFERYVLVLAVTTMVLTLAVYSLWVWTCTFNTVVAVVVVFAALLYVQEHLVWANAVFCGSVAAFTLLCSVLLPFLLPGSFTFGEISIIIQGSILFLIDFSIKVYCRYVRPDAFEQLMDKNIVAGETLFVSWLLITLVLFPIFYCIAYHENNRNDKIIYSVCFYIGGLLNLVVIFLPLWSFMLKRNPVTWFIKVLSADPTHGYLLIFWTFCVGLAFYVIWWLACHDTTATGQLPVTVVRKFFHFIAILIYLPSLYYRTYITFVSCVAIVLFLIIEIVRIFKIAPFGNSIDKLFQPVLDDHDSGKLITTHIYLLLGMSLPVWLYSTAPSEQITDISSLSVYSGVIAIGIGDSCASIFGKLYGGTSLLGSRKTWFGTLCCFVCQFLGVVVLLCSFNIRCSGWDLVLCVGSCFLVALLEGISEQIDNIVLPLYMYVLLR